MREAQDDPERLGSQNFSTTCCIAGGGPAGIMLGYLLARSGVKVTVLEKHADFLRDFRGDTIHPSTLRVLEELGLREQFLRLPHERAYDLAAEVGNEIFHPADFSQFDPRWNFVAFVPQWDFLNFLSGEASKYPTFDLRMRSQAVDVVQSKGHVRGVRVRDAHGEYEIAADLVVACDGRHSTLRQACSLRVQELGAPMDVLWFSLPRDDQEREDFGGRFDDGAIFIRLNRGDHWQCAYVIQKGALATLQSEGIETFRARVRTVAPYFSQKLSALASWDDIKLLSVAVDRLERWHQPGILFIGDAAHAMSPIGGVGINLAIQDAIATANILADKLRAGKVTEEDLAAVQRRRLWPTRVTQAFQVLMQNRFIKPRLEGKAGAAAPWPLRLLQRFPLLRRLPAKFIGMGVRPEHIGTTPAR